MVPPVFVLDILAELIEQQQLPAGYFRKPPLTKPAGEYLDFYETLQTTHIAHLARRSTSRGGK